LDVHRSPAIEREDTALSSQVDEDAVQLVGGEKIDLYVLGLQEVVSLGPSQYFSRVVAGDPARDKWKAALEDALPEGYKQVSCEQMAGLLLLIYASPELAPAISNVSTYLTGTGVGGYFGNKGAVTTRIILGETTKIVFVNSHLASGQDAASAQRRVWDVGHIVNSTRFSPISIDGVVEDDGDNIGDEDFTFWFGDLNFRLEGIPGDDIRHILTLHTRGEYDLSNRADPAKPGGEGVVVRKTSSDYSSDGYVDKFSATTPSTPTTPDGSVFDDSSVSLPDPDEFDPEPDDDPASLQATLNSLLPHDQLTRMMKQRKIFFDGWREGPISFLPSYKYDIGTVSLFDSSEKRRAPSWCDRILYRTRTESIKYWDKVKEEEEARKRDEELKARGVEEAGADDEVLFDYDPDNDGESQPQGQAGFDYDEYEEEEEAEGIPAAVEEESVENITQEIYTSHQRIMSSDHKPVISVFTLDYDAVKPELKAKVHSEVARELDRAENEGRPDITIVIENRSSGATSQSPNGGPSDQAVDFGEVRFLKKETAMITLANTGRVAATVSFVETPTMNDSGESQTKSWLTKMFTNVEDGPDASDLGKEVTLEPGETTNVVLEVLVQDMSLVRRLNDGQVKLEEVLVLRVTDGRDQFIPIRATWSPTCIGRAIDELIRVPNGGIRSFIMSHQSKTGGMGSIPYDSDVHCSAPKELFKLIEALESLTVRVLADEQMIPEFEVPQEPGWPFEEETWVSSTDEGEVTGESHADHFLRIIELLDNDKPLTEAFKAETPSIDRLEAVAEVLLVFLDSLADGIITIPLWERIEQTPLAVFTQNSNSPVDMSKEEDDRAAVFDILSTAPNHNIAFIFLTTTLTKIIGELAPLTKADLDAWQAATASSAAPSSSGVPAAVGVVSSFGRRSISFRRSSAVSNNTNGLPLEVAASMDKRVAKEKKFAEIFAKRVCRAQVPIRDRDKRILDERMRSVLGLYLRKREAG
jgi:hypothetical protein